MCFQELNRRRLFASWDVRGNLAAYLQATLGCGPAGEHELPWSGSKTATTKEQQVYKRPRTACPPPLAVLLSDSFFPPASLPNDLDLHLTVTKPYRIRLERCFFLKADTGLICSAGKKKKTLNGMASKIATGFHRNIHQ